MATRTVSVRNAVIAVVIGLLIQIAFVLSFVFAQVDPEPHGVALGLAGPPPAVEPVQQAIEQQQPGAFEFETFQSTAAAEQAIGDREVYGALVIEQQGSLRVLTASAASPAISNLLTEVARGVGESAGAQVQVQDVRPIDPDDPRGLLFNLLMMPWVTTSVLTALFLRFLAPNVRAAGHLLALAGYAVVGALVSVLIAGPFAGALPGSFLAQSGIVALVLFAVAVPTSAMMALRGVAGAGLGFLFFLVIGNIASGAASAPELLPGFWRVVGEWMPPGAGATAMRNVAYFDGVALLQPLLVLVVWSLVGAALEVLLGRRQAGRPLLSSLPGLEAAPAPARREEGRFRSGEPAATSGS
jgi:hypothetical protein